MRRQPDTDERDASPLEVLYLRHAPTIFAYLRLHSASREDAEDILLEVFLEALEYGCLSGRSENTQRAWLRSWAVGYSSDSKKAQGPTLIEHWNGTRWRVVQSPSTGAAQNLLNAVVAVRGNDVWSVGFSGDSNTSRTLIEHWNGTQWSIVSSPNPGSPQNILSGLALVPHSTRVWAVGFASNVIGSSETITEFYA